MNLFDGEGGAGESDSAQKRGGKRQADGHGGRFPLGGATRNCRPKNQRREEQPLGDTGQKGAETVGIAENSHCFDASIGACPTLDRAARPA
jgi:hypothetical protein